jgi:hypothetical protein
LPGFCFDQISAEIMIQYKNPMQQEFTKAKQKVTAAFA